MGVVDHAVDDGDYSTGSMCSTPRGGPFCLSGSNDGREPPPQFVVGPDELLRCFAASSVGRERNAPDASLSAALDCVFGIIARCGVVGIGATGGPVQLV
jgi:hypothetical protein